MSEDLNSVGNLAATITSNSINEPDTTPQLEIILGSVFVARLPALSLTNQPENFDINQDVCEICHDTLTNPVLLPCGFCHIFDSECILSWLSGTDGDKETCPKCRGKLFRSPLCNLPTDSDDDLEPEDYEFWVPEERHGELNGEAFERQGLCRYIVAQDSRPYQELLSDGADLPPLPPPQLPTTDSPSMLSTGDQWLSFEQDTALFRESQRRGAFRVPRMRNLDRRHMKWSDAEVYEHLRSSHHNWCVRARLWFEDDLRRGDQRYECDSHDHIYFDHGSRASNYFPLSSSGLDRAISQSNRH